eukprot:CAMPEP_0178950602 /NCGR_PEP_ID=MMETSP0789-20121207/6747_1 /TAXON_ID=3005 /ORGANISM="Rhizosolenia setigera, Strain CCMP 1694" /LENGTH=903 /DNA_ID=CAMNT_0020631353 /DNA_START=11 /DNA_END=2722 /DNA_ORIENTATION=-
MGLYPQLLFFLVLLGVFYHPLSSSSSSYNHSFFTSASNVNVNESKEDESSEQQTQKQRLLSQQQKHAVVSLWKTVNYAFDKKKNEKRRSSSLPQISSILLNEEKSTSTSTFELDSNVTIEYIESTGTINVLIEDEEIPHTSFSGNFLKAYEKTRVIAESSGSQDLYTEEKGREDAIQSCDVTSISDVTLLDEDDNNIVQVIGSLASSSESDSDCSDGVTFLMQLWVNETIQFDITFTNNENDSLNIMELVIDSTADEKIYGLGMQLTHLNFKGLSCVPIWVTEPGNGRGIPVFTEIINLGGGGDADPKPKLSGTEFTTSFPMPYFMTVSPSEKPVRGFLLNNQEFVKFHFDEDDFSKIEMWYEYGTSVMSGHLFKTKTNNSSNNEIKDIITELTSVTGRMKPVVDFMNEGAVMRMHGGSQKIYDRIEAVQNAGVNLSAVWIEDWAGELETWLSGLIMLNRLLWNWNPNRNLYPDWEDFVQTLNDQGIKVLIYFNPYFVNMNNIPQEAQDGVCPENYQEKVQRCDPECIDCGNTGTNYDTLHYDQISQLDSNAFLHYKDDELYQVDYGGFDASLLDLTNPDAWNYMKDLMKEQVDLGVAGWMADFGEGLPIKNNQDTKKPVEIYSGVNALLYHNQYAKDWAQLNLEVIEETSSSTNNTETNVTFFSRSGYTGSQSIVPMFWLGDQLPTWDRKDGLKTVMNGYLASALSGIPIVHSDIGGFTAIVRLFARSEQLLIRWIELEAFTSPAFRTHESNSRLWCSTLQVDSNENLLQMFAKFSQVYAILAPYRTSLMEEAYETGVPLVRPLFMEFPDDEKTHCSTFDLQFMLGSEFLVAPVLDNFKKKQDVYFPSTTLTDNWVHLFTGETYKGVAGQVVTVDAELGTPPVFYMEGSSIGEYYAPLIQAL